MNQDLGEISGQVMARMSGSIMGDGETNTWMNIAASSQVPAMGGQLPRDGPALNRILMGTRLRRLREASGITREAAGQAIRASHAKISRLELGRVGPKERDVADLLTLYGVTGDQELAKGGDEPDADSRVGSCETVSAGCLSQPGSPA
jgi:hypothetical protein